MFHIAGRDCFQTKVEIDAHSSEGDGRLDNVGDCIIQMQNKRPSEHK